MKPAGASLSLIVDSIKKVNPEDKESVFQIADFFDSYLPGIKGHILRTAYYSKLIVEKLYALGFYPQRVTEKYVKEFPLAAAIHDIGKLLLPLELLNSRDVLTEDKKEEMKKHIPYGEKIIEEAMKDAEYPQYLSLSLLIIKYHHEKFDGTGYLEGIRGIDIPLSARIVAIADVFDALTSKRSYKEAFDYQFSKEYLLQRKGTHFDPYLVDVFMYDDIQAKVRMVLEKFNKE